MTSWDDIAAALIFAAASGAVAWRAFLAVAGPYQLGCGSACQACPSSAGDPPASLLRIEPLPPYEPHRK